MLSFSISGSYTDLYALTMGEVIFREGRQNTPVCFDYFFRKIPNQGGYVVFAGLDDVLEILENLQFTDADLAFLENRRFHRSYIEYLKAFRFRGTVHSVREGELIFPNCPVLRVEGTQFEAQLVETLLLNILNYESLVATKASRIRLVAGNRVLSEFGFRRAHGPGALLASRAAVIGGFNSTSNVYAAALYNLETTGTMAHAFIESYDTELDAFRAFARMRPDHCIFLADTYDTLRSGVPNAITVAKELQQRGHQALGIRLDSGDLAWLARAARQMMDDAGLHGMKIVASNQLDEYVIRSLLDQGAPIDIFGVGTQLVTGQPDAALDGIYKLAMADGKPRLKLSENLEKVTLPGIKHVMRILDKDGNFLGADAILLHDEEKAGIIYHPFDPDKSLDVSRYKQEPLQYLVMENGRRLHAPGELHDIAGYTRKRLLQLPDEYKRFENPHIYKTSVSERLLKLRNRLRDEHKTTTHEGAFIGRYSK